MEQLIQFIKNYWGRLCISKTGCSAIPSNTEHYFTIIIIIFNVAVILYNTHKIQCHKKYSYTFVGSFNNIQSIHTRNNIYVLIINGLIKIPFSYFSILLLPLESFLWLPLGGGGGEWSDGGVLERALARLLAAAASTSMLLLVGVLSSTSRKSQINIVSSCELLTIWKSSNCSRNTLPVCS